MRYGINRSQGVISQVNRMQLSNSFHLVSGRRDVRLTAFLRPPEVVANIAVMTTVAPVRIPISDEHLLTIRARHTVLGIRGMPDCIRVCRPPLPAACVGAEPAASTGWLEYYPTATGAHISDAVYLFGGNATESVRCTEIAYNITADAQPGGNCSVSDSPLPQFPDAAFLVCSDRQGLLLPREVGLAEMTVGGHFFVVHICQMKLFNDPARSHVVPGPDSISKHIIAELTGAKGVYRNGDRFRSTDGIGDLYFAPMRIASGNNVTGNLSRYVCAGTIDLGRVFARKSAASMTAHTTVAVRHDLPAGYTSAGKRAADNKSAGGIDQHLEASVHAIV